MYVVENPFIIYPWGQVSLCLAAEILGCGVVLLFWRRPRSASIDFLSALC